MIQLIVGSLLFFVIFFGLSFILNMLLRRTWLMSVFYPIIMILLIANENVFKYFTSPGETFPAAMKTVMNIGLADLVIFSAGFLGTIVSGIVIKILRKRGYQMF